MARKLALGARPVDEPQPPAVLLDPRLAGGDESERPRAARLFQRLAQPPSPVVVEIAPRRRLEDDRQPIGRLRREHLRECLDEVTPHELRRVGAKRLDCPVEPLKPVVLPGPDEAAQETRPLLARDVDRRAVDSHPTAHARSELEQLAGHKPTLLALELELGAVRAPLALL